MSVLLPPFIQLTRSSARLRFGSAPADLIITKPSDIFSPPPMRDSTRNTFAVIIKTRTFTLRIRRRRRRRRPISVLTCRMRWKIRSVARTHAAQQKVPSLLMILLGVALEKEEKKEKHRLNFHIRFLPRPPTLLSTAIGLADASNSF